MPAVFYAHVHNFPQIWAGPKWRRVPGAYFSRGFKGRARRGRGYVCVTLRNVRITCVCVTHRNVACICWTQQVLTTCSATRNATQPRQATDECTTLDGQAHLNLARPRQYRAWVSLYKRTLPLMYSLALRFVITCARPSLRIRTPSYIQYVRVIGERERANLVVRLARFFYIKNIIGERSEPT